MSLNALKQGNSTPLSDDYNIKLITSQDFSDILILLADPLVTEYLFFAPAPKEVYHCYFDPIIEATAAATAKGEWPEKPVFIVRDNNGQFMGMAGLDAVMFH